MAVSNRRHISKTMMKRIVTILVIIWAAISYVGTIMPLPDQLQFFGKWSNQLRWSALLIVFLGTAALRYPRHFSRNGVKNLFGIGISWEIGNSYILGMSKKSSSIEPTIDGFQLRGFNNSTHVLKDARAFIVVQGGDSIPLRVTTSDGSMDHAPRVDVAPRTKIYIGGQFRNLKPSDFMVSYAPFSFVFTWSGGVSKIRFSQRAIGKQINRFKTETRAKPDTFLWS